MDIQIRNASENDLTSIMEIVNHFALNSFSVYSEEIIPDTFAKSRFQEAKVFLMLQNHKQTIGFGFIIPYKPFKNFSHTGVLTYFIYENYTGMGLGTKLLHELISRGKEIGITNYLAHISSKNIQSLNFHKKHGFEEVGRFKNVATKFNEPIDVVWVQKQFNNTLGES